MKIAELVEIGKIGYRNVPTPHPGPGEVVVKTERGEYRIKAGDLVTFPRGLKCTWKVKKLVRKVYKLGE